MIIGHQNILEYLKKSVEKNAVSHAYLFSGPKSVGKSAVALEFAKTLLCQKAAPLRSRARLVSESERESEASEKSRWFCGECDSCSAAGNNSHPDILIVKPDEGGVIAISKIRDLRSKLNLSPYFGVYQAAIIEEAEKMNKEAANTLLKTLEEPRGDKIIILTSSEPKNILPTILSRVYSVKFNLVPADLIEKEIEEAAVKSGIPVSGFGRAAQEKKKEISRLCDGRPGLAFSYLFDEEKMRNRQKCLEEFLKLISADNNERLRYAEVLAKGEENIGEILGYWTDFFRDLMFFHLNFPEKIKYAGFSPSIIPTGDVPQGQRSPERGQKELAVLSQKYPVEKTARLMRLISDVDFMVSRTNTNPQLALEVLVLAL